MRWAKKVAEGGIKGMEKPIKLKGTYKANWGDYSVLGNGKFDCARESPGRREAMM